MEDKNGSYALSKAKLPPVLPRWGFFILLFGQLDFIYKFVVLNINKSLLC